MKRLIRLFAAGYAKFTGFIRRKDKADKLGSDYVDIPRYTAEQRRVLLNALATHPGFQLLVAEFHNRRVDFEHRLTAKVADCTMKGDLSDFREIARLQESAFAWGWFQRQVQRATRIDEYLAAQAAQVSHPQGE